MSAETALPRPLTLLIRGMGLVAGVLLLLIIVLTVGDVVSRNLRDRSIVGDVDDVVGRHRIPGPGVGGG